MSEFWDITLRTIPAVASALAAFGSLATALFAWRTNLRTAVESNRPDIRITEWGSFGTWEYSELCCHLIENVGKGRAFAIEFEARCEGCQVEIGQGSPFSLVPGEQDRGMRVFTVTRSDQLHGCDPGTVHQGTLWLTIKYTDVFRSTHRNTYVIGVLARKTINPNQTFPFGGVQMPPGFVYRGKNSTTKLHKEDYLDVVKARWFRYLERIESDMKP